MRFRRPGRRPIHFCGWDRECRSVRVPWYLYLHFLADRNGRSVRIDLTPPWVRRANDRWADGLDWKRRTD